MHEVGNRFWQGPAPLGTMKWQGHTSKSNVQIFLGEVTSNQSTYRAVSVLTVESKRYAGTEGFPPPASKGTGMIYI
jgi:hypothetical protein